MLSFFKKTWRKVALSYSADNRLSDENIEAAIDIIESRGMKAHNYFAAIGHREDKELSEALDTLNSAGFLITKEQQLVGKIATRRPSSDELALQRRAEFKIVD